MSSFVIACGGTGGHLSPGIGLAQGLLAEGHSVELVISHKDVDSRLLEKYSDLDYFRINGSGFSFKPVLLAHFVVNQVRGFLTSWSFLRRNRPDAIVGFGGFVTTSIVLAGAALGIPIILHEANRRPGKTIRLLSGLAQRIYLPEGVRLKGVSAQYRRYCGFPLREEIRIHRRDEARNRLGVSLNGKMLLVLGGSQGATVLTQWVVDNFERLAEENISVYCVTGIKNQMVEELEHVTAEGRKVRAVFKAFSDEMGDLLSAADLVVSRAGAGSLAEFIRCRVPAILVPYPHAADDHQQANANFHERQGGGMLVQQNEIDSMAPEVIDLIFNDWLLNSFRRNLERLDRYHSVALIVQDIEEIAERHKEGRGH